jgi:hypothetical protein
MAEKGFHKRGFITFLTLMSFIIMTVTGFVLYFAPQGRIAYWVDWRFWGISKTDWGSIHTISCFLFVIVGIYHLVFNWKALVNYISNKVSGDFRLKKEFGIALIISLGVILGSMYQVPGIKQVLDFSEYAKTLWVKSKEYDPPIAHAEQLSLKNFAKKMNIDIAPATAELNKNGVKVANPDDSLSKIAKDNRTSPVNLYILIKKFEAPLDGVQKAAYTVEMVDERFAGKGMGKKKLAEVCQEIGVGLKQAKERLAKSQVQASDEETLHDLAGKIKVTPMDILKIILVENYKI